MSAPPRSLRDVPTSAALDGFIAGALTCLNHEEIIAVTPDPSGRDDAWCRVLVTFADGSACYVSVEVAR